MRQVAMNGRYGRVALFCWGRGFSAEGCLSRFPFFRPLAWGLFSGLALLVLTACSSSLAMRSGSYHGAVQCAPYARAVSGINLRGRAAGWWWEARGRYRRLHEPEPGSVLVFHATTRMPDGHVAVVRHVRSRRKIEVDQANWVGGRIEHGVPVEDISRRGNWSLVRVWWAPEGQMGRRVYPTYGFILPMR